MKKIILILFSFSQFDFAFSQCMEVTYETDYVFNAAKPNNKIADRTILYINKNVSEFYSYLMQVRNNMYSELQKKGASNDEIQKEKAKIPESILSYRVYKNYPTKGELTFIDRVGIQYYKYTERIEKPKWIFSKEKKEIMGYSCQKATTHFRGRDWTAWFTTSIPVSDGPWKLWGLPGLILEANDSANLYHFTAIGLKNVSPTNISLYKKADHAISCTKEQYINQIELSLKDPAAYFSKQFNGTIKIRDANGNNVKPKITKYIGMEIE